MDCCHIFDPDVAQLLLLTFKWDECRLESYFSVFDFFEAFWFSPSKKLKSARDILEGSGKGGDFADLLFWFVLLMYSGLKPYMPRFSLEQTFF